MKKLRPINFKEYIPTQQDTNGNIIEGTGCDTKEFIRSGFFHKWITNNDVVYAVIELNDGTMDIQGLSKVKFADRQVKSLDDLQEYLVTYTINTALTNMQVYAKSETNARLLFERTYPDYNVYKFIKAQLL